MTARFPRLLPILMLFATGTPATVAAQTGLASLTPGTRVLVRAASLGPAAQPARVVAASADTIVVHPDHASGFDVTLSRAEIAQLDVSAGRRTQKKRLALIGLGAGTVVGWLVGAASYSDPCTSEPAVCAGFFYETRGSDAFGGAVGGAFLGAVGGAIAGQFWKKDLWEPRSLGTQGAALRVGPSRYSGRGVEIALKIAVRD